MMTIIMILFDMKAIVHFEFFTQSQTIKLFLEVWNDHMK
jgi:hypothetical protein